LKIDAEQFYKNYETEVVSAYLHINSEIQLAWEPIELYINNVLCIAIEAIYGGFVVLPVVDKAARDYYCTEYCILRFGHGICLGNACTVQTEPEIYFKDAMPSSIIWLIKEELGIDIEKNYLPPKSDMQSDS
jgi:hypothetical protein